jgi:hypothetical protein
MNPFKLTPDVLVGDGRSGPAECVERAGLTSSRRGQGTPRAAGMDMGGLSRE